jgi:hypothetical protein
VLLELWVVPLMASVLKVIHPGGGGGGAETSTVNQSETTMWVVLFHVNANIVG